MISYLFSLAPHSVCGKDLLAPDAGTLLRLLLLAPLLEEWILRAGLQEWMLRRHRSSDMRAGIVTVVVPAIVFSLLHVGAGIMAGAAVFLPGLALGMIYLRTRDWRICALVHLLFNAFALAFCVL